MLKIEISISVDEMGFLSTMVIMTVLMKQRMR